MENKKILTEQEIVSDLMKRYPELSGIQSKIENAFNIMCDSFSDGKKLLVAGNGGSASDSEHIVGELMKSFNFPRKIANKDKKRFEELYDDSEKLIATLDGALPAISLPSFMALSTASMNDNDPEFVFAQMVNGLGQPNDVFLAISTSGNSKNIVWACKVAKAKGMKVIGLTGAKGGELIKNCDVAIVVPAEKTFIIQEYHLPIYHALCSMLEAHFFECK